jgi:hypothetical protein
MFISVPADVGKRMAYANPDKHIAVLGDGSPALPVVVISS